MKKVSLILIVAILTAFGLLTLFLSSSVIFDLFGIREKEGNYVLFIVWSNFISSVIYLFAAYSLLKRKKWTTLLLSAAVLILIAAFIALKLHISGGGIYEPKTVNAMLFRIGLTIIFTTASYLLLRTKTIIQNEKV